MEALPVDLAPIHGGSYHLLLVTMVVYTVFIKNTRVLLSRWLNNDLNSIMFKLGFMLWFLRRTVGQGGSLVVLLKTGQKELAIGLTCQRYNIN